MIFDELTQGRVEAGSRAAYQAVIERLAARGAQAVVLGCTEIGLLIGPDDSPIPVIDSAAVHAAALAAYALDRCWRRPETQGRAYAPRLLDQTSFRIDRARSPRASRGVKPASIT